MYACKSFLGDGDVGYGRSIQMVIKILTDWGKILLYSLADLPRMLWNLLPDGWTAKRWWEVIILVAFLTHLPMCMLVVKGREIPVVFSAALSILCWDLELAAVQFPHQTVMQCIRMFLHSTIR